MFLGRNSAEQSPLKLFEKLLVQKCLRNNIPFKYIEFSESLCPAKRPYIVKQDRARLYDFWTLLYLSCNHESLILPQIAFAIGVLTSSPGVDRGISEFVAGGECHLGCHWWCLITVVAGRCWAGRR